MEKILKKVIILLFILYSCKSTSENDYNKVNELKIKYDKYELRKYADEEYQMLEKKLEELNEAIIKDDKENSKNILKDVNKQYIVIKKKALPQCTNDKFEISKNELNNADQIKADIAVKEQYYEAKRIYKLALDFQKQKKYEDAIDLFIESELKFKEVYEKAKEKKDKAGLSVYEVEKKLKEFEKDLENLKK